MVDYVIREVQDTGHILVFWPAAGFAVQYPTPVDARGGALVGRALDRWAHRAWNSDVLPALSRGGDLTAIRQVVGTTRQTDDT